MGKISAIRTIIQDGMILRQGVTLEWVVREDLSLEVTFEMETSSECQDRTNHNLGQELAIFFF